MRDGLSRILFRVLRLTGLLRLKPFVVSTVVSGTRVRRVVGGPAGVTDLNDHEPHLLVVFEGVLRNKSGAIIDVGANIGQTLVSILALGVRRPYLAFEPNLAAAQQVELLAEANDATQVTVIPAGLSDRRGLARLGLSSRYDLGASIVPEFRPDGPSAKTVWVPVITGDDAVQEVGLTDVSLIKVDAEGSEPEVLRGFVRTLDRYRPFIVCELIPVRGRPYMAELRLDRRSQVLAQLRSLGYVGYAIKDDGQLTRLNDMTIDPSARDWEYLFVPSELEPLMPPGWLLDA
jgi:FkbM family methyltransferase